jgi:T5SS/PEP-CTERM-associated repeat protein
MGREGRWLHGRLVRPVILFCLVCTLLSFSVCAEATTYYADNAFGDSGFDGLSAVVTNGYGPKRHIADAITTASSGDQIAVAAGFYQESLWNPGAKIVTLLPSGQVTIVDYDPGQLDSDSDRIPDWWMLKYFGHPTGQISDQSCATCDYNGNGVDNLHEFLNRWDPTNICVAPVLYTANYQTNIVCSAIDWPGDFIVGSNTSSDVLLIQGGILSSTGDSYLGYESNSSNNTVVVDGPGSVWSNNVIYFAFSGCGNSLVITNGGQVTGDTAWAEYNPGSSNNAVLITDTGSVWNVAGDLKFNDSGNHLTIQNGGLLVVGTSYFGFLYGSSNNTALVTGSGSVWSNTSDLYITGDGGQSLVISNGGLVTDADAFLANPFSTASNNSALVTGPGSLWITADLSIGGGDMDFLGGSNRLVISDGGQLKISGSLDIGGDNVEFDSLVISNGGQVISSVATLGADEGNSNTVLVAGPDAVWNISGDLTIGASAGGNTLVISNGGSVVDNRGLIGDDCYDPVSDNTVLVTGPGSVWNNLSDLYIGAPDKYYCDAALLISNSATVYATNMVIGFAAVNTMSPVTINGGSLIVANAAENGLLDISGGTLTVNNGICRTDNLIMRNGHFSTLVYNGGSVSAGTADIENGAVIQFALGANSHPINVTGDLTLGAYINITDGGGLTNGTYTLFTYGGTLSYNGAVVQTFGNTNFSCMIDVGANGQVNGIVSPPCTDNITILLPQSNTVRDVTNIAVQVCLPGDQQLAGIYFLLDGEPSMSIVNPGWTNSLYSGYWDTACVTNGWHTLQAFASYSDESGDISEYTSPIVWVQTQNDIVFPDFPTIFGTSLPITALLSSSNATWTVNILDPSDNVLRTYSGSTTIGRIDTVWDGNDTDGASFSGDYVQVQVNTTPTGGGDPSATRRVHRFVGGYPNGFLVSYEGDLIWGPGDQLQATFDDMVQQITDIVGADPYFTTGPNIWNAIDDTPAGWQAWLGWLADPWTANLFYFGHGGPNGVGPTTNPGASEQAIGNALGNGYPWGLPFSFYAEHPYRFVFLDGCNTARAGLCLAFGIEMKHTDDAYYTARGIQPQAFMGWNNTIQYASTRHVDLNDYLAHFDIDVFVYWSQGGTLINAVNMARNIVGTGNIPMPIIWGDDQLQWNPPSQ